MGTEINGILANAFLSGVQTFEDPALVEAFGNEAELVTANIAAGGLLAALTADVGVPEESLLDLREEHFRFAELLGGKRAIVGAKAQLLRDSLKMMAGHVGRMHQDSIQTALQQVRAAMGIGSAQEASSFVNSHRAMPGAPIQIVGLRTADDALNSLMKDTRVQDILRLHPESPAGAQAVIFVLENGVAIQIEAQAPRPSSEGLATQLFVSIYLADHVRLNPATGAEANSRLWDLRKRIFGGFHDAYSTNALASAVGWTLDESEVYDHKSVLHASGAPHNLEIGAGEFDSWLSVKLLHYPQNFRAWLFYFLEVHLKNGVFEFQPVPSLSGMGTVTETD